jgi:pimeloyl-ACP methyl ester carboxylesterase
MDALSEAGFLGLRFDSRGAGGTPFGPREMPPFAVLEADAQAALDFVIGLPEADPDRVIVIGHSLGALVATRLAVARPEAIAALVLLAPAGRPLGKVLRDQALREARRLGFTPEEQAHRLAELEQSLVAAASDASPGPSSPAASSGMLHELIGIDPGRSLGRLRIPVLVAQGGKDIQISPSKDTLRLQRSLGSNSRSEVRLYPTLDHLFKRELGGSEPSHYFAIRPVDGEFIHAIIAWCRQALEVRA